MKPSNELYKEIFSYLCPRYSVSGSDNMFPNWLDHHGPHKLSGKGKLHTPRDTDEFVFVEPQTDKGYQLFKKSLTLPRMYEYTLGKHDYYLVSSED